MSASLSAAMAVSKRCCALATRAMSSSGITPTRLGPRSGLAIRVVEQRSGTTEQISLREPNAGLVAGGRELCERQRERSTGGVRVDRRNQRPVELDDVELVGSARSTMNSRKHRRDQCGRAQIDREVAPGRVELGDDGGGAARLLDDPPQPGGQPRPTPAARGAVPSGADAGRGGGAEVQPRSPMRRRRRRSQDRNAPQGRKGIDRPREQENESRAAFRARCRAARGRLGSSHSVFHAGGGRRLHRNTSFAELASSPTYGGDTPSITG